MSDHTAPPFEEQVKCLFDQFPWAKASRILRVLSQEEKERGGNMAVFYTPEELKVTARYLLNALHKAKKNEEWCSTGTGHITATYIYGRYHLSLDIGVEAQVEYSDFFMDGKYRNEFRTTKPSFKPRWRERIKELYERCKP